MEREIELGRVSQPKHQIIGAERSKGSTNYRRGADFGIQPDSERPFSGANWSNPLGSRLTEAGGLGIFARALPLAAPPGIPNAKG